MMLPLPVPTQSLLHDNSSDVTRDNTFLSVAVIYMYNRFIHKKTRELRYLKLYGLSASGLQAVFDCF